MSVSCKDLWLSHTLSPSYIKQESTARKVYPIRFVFCRFKYSLSFSTQIHCFMSGCFRLFQMEQWLREMNSTEQEVWLMLFMSTWHHRYGWLPSLQLCCHCVCCGFRKKRIVVLSLRTATVLRHCSKLRCQGNEFISAHLFAVHGRGVGPGGCALNLMTPLYSDIALSLIFSHGPECMHLTLACMPVTDHGFINCTSVITSHWWVLNVWTRIHWLQISYYIALMGSDEEQDFPPTVVYHPHTPTGAPAVVSTRSSAGRPVSPLTCVVMLVSVLIGLAFTR